MKSYEPESPWLVVVNPNAGKRKGEKDWKKISALLDKNFQYTSVFTEGRGHAIDLVEKKITEGTKKIIVAGGDGTMNEVVNGIFSQTSVPTKKITLGMITIGTGNDWGRMFSIPKSYAKAIATLINFRTFLQDAGVARYYHGKELRNRFFINIAGLGFDAFVAREINVQKDKGRTGVILYIANILSNLWRYRNVNTHIKIDNDELKDEVFTISIGIGKYSGGGMKQTPNSIPDDGFFDLTVIKKMKKLEVIRSLPLLYNGNILSHPKVESFRGKKIHITAEPEIHIEADGESLGHSPIEIEIIPRSIMVIIGDHPY